MILAVVQCSQGMDDAYVCNSMKITLKLSNTKILRTNIYMVVIFSSLTLAGNILVLR